MKRRKVLPYVWTILFAAAIIGAGVSAPWWMEKVLPSYRNFTAEMEYEDIQNVWERQQSEKLFPWNYYDEKEVQQASTEEQRKGKNTIQNLMELYFSLPQDWIKNNPFEKIKANHLLKNTTQTYYFLKDGRVDLNKEGASWEEYLLFDFVLSQEQEIVYFHMSELIDAQTNKPLDEISLEYDFSTLTQDDVMLFEKYFSSGVVPDDEGVRDYLNIYFGRFVSEFTALSDNFKKGGQLSVSQAFLFLATKMNLSEPDVLYQDDELLLIYTLEEKKKRLTMYYRIGNFSLNWCGYSLEPLAI